MGVPVLTARASCVVAMTDTEAVYTQVSHTHPFYSYYKPMRQVLICPHLTDEETEAQVSGCPPEARPRAPDHHTGHLQGPLGWRGVGAAPRPSSAAAKHKPTRPRAPPPPTAGGSGLCWGLHALDRLPHKDLLASSIKTRTLQ